MNNLSPQSHRSVLPAMEVLEGRTLLSQIAAPAPGSLDSTFGRNGAVYFTAQRPMDVQTVAAAALPGGKTLLLGSMQVYPAYNFPSPTFSLARFNADGSSDRTFGPGGVRIVLGMDSSAAPPKGVLNGIIFHPYAMAVDGRGRIYVGGEDTSSDGVIARLNPDGSADDTFGDHGFVYPALAEVNAIAFALDGTAFVGGYIKTPFNNAPYSSPHDFGIARLRDNGMLEDSFGDHGLVIAKFGGRTRHRNSAVHALSIDVRGRVLAAGGEDGVFDLARFGVDGLLDRSFGSGGEAAIVGDGRPNSADGVEVPGGPFFDALALRQQDGEIFAAGGSPRTLDYGMQGGPLVVAAFKSNGTLDWRFGKGGIVQVPVGDAQGSARQAQANGVALLRSGRILLSGTFGVTAV